MSSFATKFRPKSFETFLGQVHLVGEMGVLKKLVQENSLPHSFFFGPPGTGKTTLARIIANKLDKPFYEKNATSLKIEDLRILFNQYKNALNKPILFIDEVHRLAKNQQEVLLPIMEENSATIIGASTENPFFSLTGAIRSRSFLFEFFHLKKDELLKLINNLQNELELKIEDEAKDYLIHSCGGDCRAMINLIEFALKISKEIRLNDLKALRTSSLNDGSFDSQTHYDLISAMIKSMRGSDPNSAIYYFARLYKAGEDPKFIARRLVIFSSEDIGNANPNALIVANSCYQSVKEIGWPEARIIISQTIIYLASSPKSNRSYVAINNAISAVENGLLMEVPTHLKESGGGSSSLGYGVGYKYPHDFGGWVEQSYTKKPFVCIPDSNIAYEKKLNEWLDIIKKNN